MIDIDIESARVALKSVVAEFGKDYLYEERTEIPSHVDPDGDAGGSCFYVHDDNKEGSVPGCLIAQVLHKHFEWSIDDLKDIEGRSARDIPGLPLDVSTYFQIAQAYQDGGDTWGDALRVAERRYMENFE